MKLSDYPTPLTDEQEEIDNGETGPLLDFARDLERKLAMCRGSLKSFAETSSSSRIRREAKQTLEETK